MDDTQDKQAKPTDLNTLDLSQLQGFSFGTKWESKPAEKREGGPRGGDSARPARREFGAGSGGGPRRDRRTGGGEAREREGNGGGAAATHDRRGFRRSGPASASAPSAGANGRGEPSREGRAQNGGAAPSSFSRSGGADDRRAQGSGGRSHQGGRGGRGGDRFAPHARERQYEPPYDSPHFAVSFYPEDKSFASLAKTMRSSYRTLELFEIARTVVAKNDRFIAHLTRKPAAPPAAQSSAPADAPRPPIYIARPDGVPFDSEDAVIHYVVSQHIGQFFHTEQVQIDPPKGNFQVINRCGVTGELLGPPNYHRYNQIVQQHFDTRIKHLSFDAFRAKIETLRDPEAVAQWLEKMKTITRYTWRGADAKKTEAAAAAKVQAAPPAAAASTESVTGHEPSPTAEASAPTADVAAADTAAQTEGLPAGASETVHAENAENPANTASTAPASSSPETSVAETQTPAVTAPETTSEPSSEPTPAAPPAPPTAPTFDSLEEARLYLLTHARGQVYRTSDTARFHGNLLDKLPEGEIRRAIEGALERQRRFPLDTANGLRGRLRREHFTIFKKGSKGIAYVCAVKRKFRTPGQTFADSIAALIEFIEKHPMVLVSELPERFLGIKPAENSAPETSVSAASEASANAVSETSAKSTSVASDSSASAAPASPSAGPTDAASDAPNEAGGENNAAPAAGPAVAVNAAPAAEKPVGADTIAEREALHRLQLDLRWLVTEGYVTEFIDGRLFAAPPMPEARKRAAETGEEHDPENFPDAPKPEASEPEPQPAPQESAAPPTAKPEPTEVEPTEPAPAPAATAVAPAKQ